MLNIAIAGLGTVGASVMRALQDNEALITSRSGKITVTAVSARDKNKKRDCKLPSGVAWVDDPLALASMPGIDVVVELIGGAEGVARKLADATLKSGKHFVTANKALIATHGVELAKLAESHQAQLSFEAAVAGGIPIIKTLREGLAGNNIAIILGILNGTSNYILTRMRDDKLSFDAALREAQSKGYAEADPSADIDGHDSANKLAILASLAFGGAPDLAAVHVQGIRHITPLDLQFADELGCCVKLLGVAHIGKDGLEQQVAPRLVPKQSPLAQVDGALNAVLVRGNFVGDLMLEGQGAGGDATASAVVADLVDLARGHHAPAFGVPVAQLKTQPKSKPSFKSRYYLRLQVMDKPGVVADISAILRDGAISIESLLQRGTSATESVPVVITTHQAQPDAMNDAVNRIAKLATIVEKPCLLQIED